ncbi:SMP-30/gluconolactonase/LRE family protein [Pontibacter sp. KCTC 32443]|uniref:SMP-30/gluconolactonase/LRE family protein n=1 Tax=Pontibacter TaxID=323449 RepID=UPI00164E6C46|nr:MULTISPECIES: SMP-30/gluconolactonase/LRE family protein [Pontibacter]MBC5774829.1 SMP-30/gluconolactonase/LRE family protein [Pontibacter sp. KCTC 32443]
MSITQQLTEAKLILNAKAIVGEGALWHPREQVLYWVDIEGRKLHIFDPKTEQDKVFTVKERIGTVVPLEEDGVLVALQNGIHKLDTETGKLTFILNPINENDIRFNDGKCDAAGRFWVGTMALDTRKGAAVLYRIGTDKSINLVLDDLTISNGIVWSADNKKMYFIDTPTHQVRAFDYNLETGEISNSSVVIEIPDSEGSPDGMAIDADGNLWVALHKGGAVGCWNPETGKMLRKITVPAPQTTSCAFGGKDLDILYITSGTEGLSEEQLQQYPDSGGLFAVKPGVRGVPANFCKTKQ